MTISNELQEPVETSFDRLVTPEFAQYADFAGFRAFEAVAIQETGHHLTPLLKKIASELTGHLVSRPETASLFAGAEGVINESLTKEWLDRTAAGPFDGEFAAFLRTVTHLPGHGATFPGVQIALPPQMILAILAWLQGKILAALAETCDTSTVSVAGAAWMDQLILQLGIILEPYLAEPEAPPGKHESAEFHPYGELAGFGAHQQNILRKTGPLLEPAGGGVVAVAYDYLLSRPESAGYFQDAQHLAMRKQSLKGWWTKSTSLQMDHKFHSYMSRVADAHVKGGGRFPNVVIPPQLTIALMGWVQMRVMIALNTVARDAEDNYVFGTSPDPLTAGQIGTAWTRMLTLQLGLLLKPYLAAAPA